jgi:predicted DNA-binding transcriptional regulator AlpA
MKQCRRVLRFKDLKERGIVGSRMSLHRARQNPDFPMPILIGGGIGWFEDEIDQWLENRPRCISLNKPNKEAEVEQ